MRNGWASPISNYCPGDAVGYVDIGRSAVYPNLLIAKNLADQVVTDVKTEDFHQVATDQSVVHQQLQVTVAVAEQGRHRVAAAAQLDVAIHLAEGFLHHLDVWHQRLQLQASRLQIGLTLQRLFIALQVYAAGNRPVGQAKAHPAWFASLGDRHSSQYQVLTRLAQYSLAREPHVDKVATPKAAVSMAKKTSLVVVVIMALLTIYGTLV